MKRLVWLLLLAFGALLVQVPAVETTEARTNCCDCCRHPGKGTMNCTSCLACGVACPLALPADSGLVATTLEASGRIILPAEYGQRLNHRPLLTPPRAA